MNSCEPVGTGVKGFDQVLIPALRRLYKNKCEVLFFLEGESHDSQIWPTLRQSYTIIYIWAGSHEKTYIHILKGKEEIE